MPGTNGGLILATDWFPRGDSVHVQVAQPDAARGEVMGPYKRVTHPSDFSKERIEVPLNYLGVTP